jgi:hypothetical protein
VYHYNSEDEEEDRELMCWGLDLEPKDLIADDWDVDSWGEPE